MLIHALFDNKASLGDGLTYQLYNGYFSGTDASPNTTWFDTAELLTSGTTSDLSSLATATNNTFQQNFSDAEAMNDNWNVSGYTYVVTQYGTPPGTITATRSNNNLRLTMTNSNDPALILEGASRPAIDTNSFKYIHLRYKVVSGNVDQLFLFYYTTFAGGNGGSIIRNYGNVVTGQWYNIVLDMTNISNWTTGNWNKFRLDPITGGTATIDFDYFIISNSPIPPDYNTKSLKISGAFRAKKTGIHRFFTRSDDASFLYIDGILTVSNGGTHTVQDRFANVSMVAGTYYQFILYYGDFSAGQEFSAGYLEPNNDGTTSGSSNTDDFIKNGSGLNVYFLNNYSSGGGTFSSSLTYTNPSLYGRYKINIISMLVDRTNFSTGKDDLLYTRSPQLYQPGSGTLFLVLHEEPVSSDFERKDYHSFSDDFEVVTELNGYIELIFQRLNINAIFQRALLVMQAEKI